MSTIESSDSNMSSFHEVEHCIEREVFFEEEKANISTANTFVFLMEILGSLN